ncbi:hypothetical protein GE061_011886 [Apolygus lucorum]|uniref:Uncharacterized protein n=1 Tax=Apolygus lucorum TaxID=248454 RepID=A0A8S9XRX5_APOLU|nr:hypothetical protein GE061_011886 [Apolygus lucorum]
MFCKVFTNGTGNYVFMNPNCNIKLIYEYLRVVADIPDEFEIDLCSESGYLLGLYDAECTSSGLTYLKPRASYYIFIFSYEENKPDLFEPRPLMDFTDSDFVLVFRQIKKNFGIPKDEVTNEEDAVLIFEHMLTAYEERVATDREASTHLSEDDATKSVTLVGSTGRRGSRKSISKNGPCKILQTWREEKRAKLAALTATPSEELLDAYQSTRRRSRKSQMSFRDVPSLMVGEEIEEEHDNLLTHKQKLHSVTKKGKKGDKKKKAAKDTNRVSEKQDDILRKAPTSYRLPKVNITPENSEVSTMSKSLANINLDHSNEIKTFVSIREFFRSHSSSTVDLQKPASDELSEGNIISDPAIEKNKGNLHVGPKKRSTRTK